MNIKIFLKLFLFTFITCSSLRVFAGSESAAFLDSLNSLSRIYFDFNSCELRDEAKPVLDEIALIMKEHSYSRLEIIGYCDGIGTFEYNLELSKKRAAAVANYLISKGCNPGNIVAVGLGKSSPVSTNSTSEGRQKNRRVEFRWIEEPIVKYEELDANGVIKLINREEVSMEFNVNDKDGNPVTDVKEENINAVLKWKTDKADSTSGTLRLIPIDDRKKIAVALTMDYSGSMWDLNEKPNPPKTAKILGIEKAVTEFISQMNSSIYAMIVKFGTDIQVVQKYTNDRVLLEKAVGQYSHNMGWTALFKSIHVCMTDTVFSYDPTFMKTVIAFTDGEENRSGRITIDSVTNKANSLGIRIYTVGMLDRVEHSTPPGFISKDERDLVEIAEKTGGFYNYAPDAQTLAPIYTTIINQIKNSYTVSILWNQSKLPPKGTPVKAVVTIKMKNRIKSITRDYVIE
jgi:hypothetical protein